MFSGVVFASVYICHVQSSQPVGGSPRIDTLPHPDIPNFREYGVIIKNISPGLNLIIVMSIVGARKS